MEGAMVFWILAALVGCDLVGREPVEGGSCTGNERRCDAGNNPFECGDDGKWAEAQPYCVCVADADEDGYGEVQCAAVAVR